MRKTVSLLLAAVMILTGIIAAVPALAMGTQTYYVACSNGGDLNLRQEPSKNSAGLAKIPYGTKLEIAGLSDDGAWGFCSYGNKQGWVMMSFLSQSVPDPSKSKAEKARADLDSMNNEFKIMNNQPLANGSFEVEVRTNKTTTLYHLRWAPTMASFAMRSDVTNGEVFTVTAEGKDWYQVRDNQSARPAYIVKSICQVRWAGQ
jgi:uncharacterized protein YgiM (DUF1202 family)